MLLEVGVVKYEVGRVQSRCGINVLVKWVCPGNGVLEEFTFTTPVYTFTCTCPSRVSLKCPYFLPQHNACMYVCGG